MSRMPNERVFGAALSNEYQWRNLYLKEFGCCTYAPPLPKDPTTTAEGIYPLRRQVAQLNQTFSESDSEDFTDAGDERRTSLSLTTSVTTGRDTSFHSVSHISSSGVQNRGTVGDQFFLLDLSSRHSSLAQQQQRGTSKRGNGGRRTHRGAALRKDEFFDVNDAFSTKFFGFLWRRDEDDDEVVVGPEEDEEEEKEVNEETNTNSPVSSSSANRTVTTDTISSAPPTPHPQRRQQQQQGNALENIVHDPHAMSRRLTFTRNPLFSSLSRSDWNDNPHGVHPAMLRLHHETWAMLMDNRLMAWLHRQTADQYQSATQLRQRLLDVVARGPSSIAAGATATSAAGVKVQRVNNSNIRSTFSSSLSCSPAHTQEEALQNTFESFSPFFVVIAPPAAVQRAKDQFQAARRAQLRGGSRSATTAPADIVGLPLFSQYGSWREAYEHRRRWGKAPFSFFLLHDSSYNYAQVTAIFVQLHLLYVHAHSHTRLCAEVKPETVALHNAGQPLPTTRTINCPTEYQRMMCPLTAIHEATENIILAYEQSNSRATLTMLRRVLDFLTDAALDVVTAHRFISREALLRQSGFDLPGMGGRNARAPATSIGVATNANTTTEALEVTAATSATAAAADASTTAGEKMQSSGSNEDDDDNSDEDMDTNVTPTSDNTIDSADPVEEAESMTEPEEGRQSSLPKLTPVMVPLGLLEQQRVTEKDVNDLFELAYWFVDAATANAGVPIDEALIQPAAGLEMMDLAASSAAAVGNDLNTSNARDTAPLFSLPPAAVLYHGETRSLTNTRYLPGKEVLFSPVESFVEAVELLEAHRKLLWTRHASKTRSQAAQQTKKIHIVAFPRDELPRASFTTTTATASPMLSADSFSGLATPLVVLTTYLRLHGGQWLKQLCNRVFDTLRKHSVLLYVNTVDLDAMWARLQDPSLSAAEGLAPTPTTIPTAAGRTGVNASVRGRDRGSTRVFNNSSTSAGAASSSALSTETATDLGAMRRGFIDGIGRLEAVIAQDILYAITEFFEALHGKRAAGRLPHGISVLLTQFVTTVHLFLLEVGGGIVGGVFSTNDIASSGSPPSGGFNVGHGHHHRHSKGAEDNNSTENSAGGGKRSTTHQGGNSNFDASPTRQVEERLQVFKQRYYANLRRRQVNSAEAYRAATAATTRPPTGTEGINIGISNSRSRLAHQQQEQRQRADRGPPTAPAAVPKRLIQTIEHHRLAKFVLFDCWILPALNNAVALGYLAPDSPLHLRWNVDALARYLKVLLHAPFVEQDRLSFASLAEQGTTNGSYKSGDVVGGSSNNNGNGGARGKSSKGGPASRHRVGRSTDSGVQRTNVLTLPPYLAGIYDVATGSLVRLQAAASATTTPVRTEASTKSLSRSSVAAKGPKLEPNFSPLSPETMSLAGSTDQYCFVRSGGEMNDVSNLDDQSPAWDRSKRSLLEPLTTATTPGIALRGPLSPLFSPPVDGKGWGEKAAAPPSLSGSTAAPILRSNATFSPLEKQLLPPVTSIAEMASDIKSLTVGSRAAYTVSNVLSSTLSSSSKGGAEASRSSVSQQQQRRSSSRKSTKRQQRHASGTSTDSAFFVSGPARLSTAGIGGESTLSPDAQHAYVLVNDAGWMDISPTMQFLNEQLGLTCNDPDDDEVGSDELVFPHLPTAGYRHGPDAAKRTAAAAATIKGGLRLPSMNDIFNSSTTHRGALEEPSAVQALNSFCKAAAADESENVVVSEFDVLPTMAAGCIEKLYDVVTGAHPMVARALQTGAFNFTGSQRGRASGGGGGVDAAAAGFSSLYSACLNGVLLHPRTAAQVMRNVFENSPAFGQALMKPVVSGTALELLSGLVALQGETPMVDANSIVPLLQMCTSGGSGDAMYKNGENGIVGGDTGAALVLRHGGNNSDFMATNATATAQKHNNIAVLTRRWENESRRLLRQFTFLATGFADAQRPLPLVPGLRRPVGPAHPIHMIRAGADRITADMGAGAVPIVFDPWWRAMVVALSVKAANMFDECRDEHAAAFLNMVHKNKEAAKQTNRQATVHFVATKGKETDGKAGEEGSAKRTPTSAARRTRAGAAAAPSRRGRDTRHKSSESDTLSTHPKQAARRSFKARTTASVSSATGS